MRFRLLLSERFIHLDGSKRILRNDRIVFVSFYRRGSFIKKETEQHGKIIKVFVSFYRRGSFILYRDVWRGGRGSRFRLLLSERFIHRIG